MPSFRTGTVTEILGERRGLQRVRLDIDPDRAAARAYVLTQLVGSVAVGDRVIVNTTAVELGLGTGGWHVVHWNLERVEWHEPGPGHIVKLRYTSLQADTGAAEEVPEGGPAPDAERVLAEALDSVPVVACTLHSQIGAVAVAIDHLRPGTRIVYVMTDGAALPAALSDLVADLTDRHLLRATVTCGHAFGGDLEAVSVASGMELARRRLGAEVILVGMGPGVVGTGTRLGTTSVEAAAILDTAAALGATALLCPRMSDGDPRRRHEGLSHHARTVLELCRTPVTVPWPAHHAAVGIAPHHLVPVDAPDMAAILDASGLDITTMGRGPGEDPLFFAACGAVGRHVASLLGDTDDQ